ncbi:pectinesterase inhibitor 9-like [Tripterygium wilfordii]|uniref:pectinesterase inhibitor 9-like n=1 Tax=Tripterygium wilfordii TaxID=458696 RepID=UPI0018F83127|nr:pectinesterase inhibitor 9-like [Tripterygium wilfordii]
MLSLISPSRSNPLSNMAKYSGLYLLLLCFALSLASKAEPAVTRDSSPTDFIKSSCRSTRYPALCVQCLSGYANAIRGSEHHLAQVALTVSLSQARSAAAFVSKLVKVRGLKPREYEAVKDCIDNMGDSVDRLGQSVKELGHMGGTVGQDFVWHMSNVQTWASAALTDENTCLDGFGGRQMEGNVKTVIRNRIVNVARVTSNALALVNRFAARHGAAAAATEEPQG